MPEERPKGGGPDAAGQRQPDQAGQPTARGYRLQGRVQGVGFRWWTRRQADALGLRGTVRNCADGTVEVRVLGPPSALRTLEERLRQGPPPASVERIQQFAPDPWDPPPAFEIRR